MAQTPGAHEFDRDCCYLVKNLTAVRHRGIKLKCFLKLLVQCGGCSMKRRSARQLVRLLSDIRHATHCSTLRAAATSRAIELAAAEADEPSAEDSDSVDDTRDAAQDERSWRRS